MKENYDCRKGWLKIRKERKSRANNCGIIEINICEKEWLKVRTEREAERNDCGMDENYTVVERVIKNKNKKRI